MPKTFTYLTVWLNHIQKFAKLAKHFETTLMMRIVAQNEMGNWKPWNLMRFDYIHKRHKIAAHHINFFWNNKIKN